MKSTVPLFLVLVLAVLAGCRSPQDPATRANNSAALPGAGSADQYRVRAATTAFFHISPLQAAGPDDQLKKDTELTMITPSRSYSRVKTPGGDTGYVATEDIGVLTSGEIAAANVSSVQAQLESQRQTAARSMGGDGYTIPPEAGSQEKLPEPDARPAGVKPGAGPSANPTPNPIFHQ